MWEVFLFWLLFVALLTLLYHCCCVRGRRVPKDPNVVIELGGDGTVHWRKRAKMQNRIAEKSKSRNTITSPRPARSVSDHALMSLSGPGAEEEGGRKKVVEEEKQKTSSVQQRTETGAENDAKNRDVTGKAESVPDLDPLVPIASVKLDSTSVDISSDDVELRRSIDDMFREELVGRLDRGEFNDSDEPSEGVLNGTNV